MPITIWGVSPREKNWEAAVPRSTRVRSSAGMALWPTANEVSYHVPPLWSTDREPGRVSMEPMSWST